MKKGEFTFNIKLNVFSERQDGEVFFVCAESENRFKKWQGKEEIFSFNAEIFVPFWKIFMVL